MVYFRRWYDLVQSRAIRRTSGKLPDAREMAVYLIYPNMGLLQSHLHALNVMASQGIAPLVVSNLPLSDHERGQVAALSCGIIERPNVGYDFGGYRDGVMELAPKFAGLERLWILNDSCWMVDQPTSWFEDARELDVDLVGSASNCGIARPPVHRLQEITWNYSAACKHFHYTSFALGFSAKVIATRAFQRFWSRLEIRDDKKQTVQRGEVGLTQWAIANGFTHGSTSNETALGDQLARLDNRTIDRIAGEIVILDGPALYALSDQAMSAPNDTIEGRERRINFILTAVARQGSAYTLPGYNIDRGFQFLKKSPMWLTEGSAETMTGIIARIGGPIGEVIRSEAGMLRNQANGSAPEGKVRSAPPVG